MSALTRDADPATDGQVLTGAGDLVARRGLHKGDYWPGFVRGTAWNGYPVCGAGAVRVATGNNPSVYVRVLGVFADWLVLNGHAGRVALDDVDVTDAAETVAAWSDDPARTAEQVADALRACAADNGETTTPSQLRHLPQTAEATTGGSR